MPSSPSDSRDIERIPLAEEQLTVDKRTVIRGHVRAHVSVEDHQEMITTELARDDVRVERYKVERPVDAMPLPVHDGDVLIVPVVEERLIVTRQLVVVEELHISRSTTRESVDIPVTLRKMRATVERTSTLE